MPRAAMQVHVCRSAAFSIGLLFALPADAAVDSAKVRAAIEAQLAVSGAQIQLGSVDGRGDDIVVSDVRITDDKGEKTSIGSVTLESVTAVRGGFNIARITVPARSIPTGDGTFEFGGATINDLTLPEVGAPKDVVFYALGFDVGAMRLSTSAGQDIARSSRLRVVGTPIDANRETTFVMEPWDIFLDTTRVPRPDPDPAADEAMRALDLTKLDLRIASRGLWRLSDGRVTTDMTFNLRNAGTLTTTMDFSGYTPDVIDALSKIMKENATAPKATPQQKQDSDAQAGIAIIGIAQQMSLSVLSFRYEDASFAARALDYAAKKNGVSRRELVNQIKGMVPVLAIQTKDAEFTTRASNAVSAFLDNPKSLEIRAQPPAPASFMQLFAIGAVTPGALIKQLNVSVTANK